MPQGKPQALIVAPTRELALQVSGDLAPRQQGPRPPGAHRLRRRRLRGASSTRSTAGVDIVVGTPGRLIDLANRRALDLSHVHALVLDEADEMLDLGFLPDVERILKMTPETRQTMLFSATMPAAIVSLARTHMRHPMNIRAESSYDTQLVPATAQFIYQAHDLDKPEIIGRILQAEDADKIIVFTRTKRQSQRVADDLAERGFSASPAARRHGPGRPREGARPSSARTRSGCWSPPTSPPAASTCRASPTSSTTRCPEDEKTYIHRIGRTGRAGATGIAITFVDWADLRRWKMINKALDLPFEEPQETYSTLRAPLPRPGHPAGHQGPDRRPGPGRAGAARALRGLGPPPRRATVAATATAAVRAAAQGSEGGAPPPPSAPAPQPTQPPSQPASRPAGSRNRRRRRRPSGRAPSRAAESA